MNLEKINRVKIDATYKTDLLPRKKDSHKGTYGKVLIVAGSKTMAGAAILSATAAYRTGSGIVKVLTEEGNEAALFSCLPEAIVMTYVKEKMAFEKYEPSIVKAIAWADTILIGPGIGLDDYSKELLACVMQHGNRSLVIDADGLTILSDNMSWIKKYKGSIIVTPHMGEMSRLMKCSLEEIADVREKIALGFTADHKVTTVLKSDKTIVATEDTLYTNTLGNPGMATAGSGDVLSGIIVSLLGQGVEAERAAPLGVYIHSRAGDHAKDKVGEYSLMARDIIEAISDVLKESL